MQSHREKGSDAGSPKREGMRKATGIILALLGLFWFAHQAGWLQNGHGHTAAFWPLAMLGFGVFLIFSSRHGIHRSRT
jgi:hypothetical protein